MKKDELYGKINQLSSVLGWQGHGSKVVVAKDSVLELVRHLDEPKKVVIPQFVAEWIEYVKKDRMVGSITYALFHSTSDYPNMDAIELWREPWENQEIIARAWLDGYEVEREKLYTVEIPDDNNKAFTHTILTHTEDGDLRVAFTDVPDWKKEKRHHLTESEIRKDFEWAWQWAEEVKGVR